MIILNYSKAEGLSWLGHVHRLISDKMVKNYTSGNRYQQGRQGE
jgi:hypothetical protein